MAWPRLFKQAVCEQLVHCWSNNFHAPFQFSGGLGGEGYGPPGGGGSSAQAHAARTNPKFRTQLCVAYMTRGACPTQFTSCMFAHGEDQLVNKDSYKTVMCK